MRIAVYYPRFLVGDGGPTLALRGWARALAVAGAQVHVLCQGGGKGREDRPVQWRLVRHRGAGRWLTPTALRDALVDADVLVLHSGWVWHNVVAARAARRLRIPYVITPHGAYDPNVLRRRRVVKRAWWRVFERRILAGAAAAHVFFEGEREFIRQLGYGGRFITVPNGTELPPSATWDGGSGGYVLWLGRYDVELKGLDILLEAISEIAPGERPRLRLHGPDHRGGRAVVERMVSQLGLGPCVSVGGPVYGGEKDELLARALAFAYPSRWDAHSVAVTEALARGVPCVVSDRMQIAGLLGPARAAFVAPLSAKGLAAAIAEAVCPPAAAVGAAGRLIAEREFSWAACAQRFLRALREIMAERTGPQ